MREGSYRFGSSPLRTSDFSAKSQFHFGEKFAQSSPRQRTKNHN
jgi:hypothetical protein